MSPSVRNPLVVAILIGAVWLTGCGAKAVTPTTTTTFVNQQQVAILTAVTGLTYAIGDTLLVTITDDRMSVEGGGGLVPIAIAMPLVVDGTTGAVTATRVNGTVTEVWSIILDATGTITGVQATLSGTTTGSLTANSIAAPPTTLVRRYLLDDLTNNTYLYVDAKGRCWWDTDLGKTTATDTLFVQVRGTGPLVGAATVSGPVTHTFSLTVDNTGLVTDAMIDGIHNFVSSPSPLAATAIGPWSASMAGHWMGMPSSGSHQLSGNPYLVTRTVTPFTNYLAGPTFGLATPTGPLNETESVTVSYAEVLLNGYPVIRETTSTTITPNTGGPDEIETTAVFYARAIDGSVRRVGTAVDGDGDLVIAPAEIVDGTATVVTAFPAARPVSGTVYAVTDVRMGLVRTITQVDNQTIGSRTGAFRFDGVLTTTTSAIATGTYDSVTGVALDTTGTIQDFWQPGNGLVGRNYANVTIERDFVTSGTDSGTRTKRVIANGAKVSRQ